MNSLQWEYLNCICFEDALNMTKIFGAAYGLALSGCLASSSPGSALAISYVAGFWLLANGGKIKGALQKVSTMIEYIELTASPEKCPLEYVDKIKITDEKSLDAMLQRTANDEEKEWGTVHKAHATGNEATIFEIMEPALAEERGIIRKQKFTSVHIRAGRNSSLASKWGYYGGFHHYHPTIDMGPDSLSDCVINFEITSVDRGNSIDKVNLLTFNMPYEPELIGYNVRHIYLPTDDTKRTLVQASPLDVYSYLGIKSA